MAGGFSAFGWGELFSLLAVVISFATICVSMFGRSKNETKNEQRMFDKLDALNESTTEIRNSVNSINSKIDSHAERLAKLESGMETAFRRLSRLERTIDDHSYLNGDVEPK